MSLTGARLLDQLGFLPRYDGLRVIANKCRYRMQLSDFYSKRRFNKYRDSAAATATSTTFTHFLLTGQAEA